VHNLFWPVMFPAYTYSTISVGEVWYLRLLCCYCRCENFSRRKILANVDCDRLVDSVCVCVWQRLW